MYNDTDRINWEALVLTGVSYVTHLSSGAGIWYIYTSAHNSSGTSLRNAYDAEMNYWNYVPSAEELLQVDVDTINWLSSGNYIKSTLYGDNVYRLYACTGYNVLLSSGDTLREAYYKLI